MCEWLINNITRLLRAPPSATLLKWEILLPFSVCLSEFRPIGARWLKQRPCIYVYYYIILYCYIIYCSLCSYYSLYLQFNLSYSSIRMWNLPPQTFAVRSIKNISNFVRFLPSTENSGFWFLCVCLKYSNQPPALSGGYAYFQLSGVSIVLNLKWSVYIVRIPDN